ncbi:MAG: RnfABCDGE type electron transport complex subunit G [Cetobacterium sp.]|uniref:RnfABCDGE type electron transport complex subunit G n=1 Tax=unclassified Cetobacterium TaxID=2630983 RepID=UPI00163D3264|nr:RnfABCDGE type electron transport complex subunit G [Cetobacterium sp. 2A]MBC2856236.1 RnfABCDGE type electron transport complex subunit G [Cetobacterium sp. 2A]
MQRNRFIHYAFVLTLIASISAGILSVVNGFTSKVIAENSKKAVNAARVLVLPMAKQFDEGAKIEVEGLVYIPGMDELGKVVGYVVTVSEPGYAANIDFVLGVDRRGRVTGMDIIGSQETPGLGSKIMDKEWQKKAVGKDEKYEFNKSTDGFSGATISPQAVYRGINRALKTFKSGVRK